MLVLNTRFQIAAICFFIIIVFDYIRNEKLPLLSTTFFSSMIIFAGLNLCFDFATVYTISHLDTVSPVINRLCHQLFITTLLIMIISLYQYVEILAHNQKRMNIKKFLLTMIPFAFSMLMMIFGELNYYVDGSTVYSYGPMATTVYVSVAFYLVLIISNTFFFYENIRKEKRIAIRAGSMIWVIAAVIQFLNPGMLVSGLAIVLMLLFIYLSFENPKEHTDEATGTFNKRAFHLMLGDQFESGKNVLVVSVVVDDLGRIQTAIGHDKANLMLEIIGNKIQFVFQTSVYHSRSNVMSILIDKKLEAIAPQLKEIESFIEETIVISQFSVVMKSHIDIIDTGFFKDSCDDIYEMMNYMADHHQDLPDSRVHVLDNAMVNEKARYTTIENLLHAAIENDGFQVVYQPIFDVRAEKFHSAEALVRLKDTTTVGFIPPDEFILIAEKKGMIMDLGRIVFEKVCQFTQENDLPKMGIEYIEVNLSGIQCVHPDLPKQLQTIMKRFAIKPAFINLEITETASVESGEMLNRNMLHLKNMGCSFSMDDFGTGYSNLSQMAEVVYDLVKLDRSLIWPYFYEENTKSHAILVNVINMLLELNVKIVAEGVETKEMTDYLSEHGITYLQGYYFSKPLAAADFLGFINEKNA